MSEVLIRERDLFNRSGRNEDTFLIKDSLEIRGQPKEVGKRKGEWKRFMFVDPSVL
jgi:hypothetical protein